MCKNGVIPSCLLRTPNNSRLCQVGESFPRTRQDLKAPPDGGGVGGTKNSRFRQISVDTFLNATGIQGDFYQSAFPIPEQAGIETGGSSSSGDSEKVSIERVAQLKTDQTL